MNYTEVCVVNSRELLWPRKHNNHPQFESVRDASYRIANMNIEIPNHFANSLNLYSFAVLELFGFPSEHLPSPPPTGD